MTKAETSQLLTVLTSVWDHKQITEAVVEAWHAVLREFSFDDCLSAAHRWMIDHKWFPTPAEIRDLIDMRPYYRQLSNESVAYRRAIAAETEGDATP